MANAMVRNVLSVIAGVVVAMAFIFLVEGIMGVIYPPIPGTDLSNRETVRHLLDNVPRMVFLWLLIGYGVGSFAGGLVATLASFRQSILPALIVGAIVTIGGVMDLIDICHPLWFSITSLALYIPFALLGYLLLRKTKAA